MPPSYTEETLRFDGRVAIVTGSGGAGGLGREIATQLARRGAKVIVNGRREDMVDDAVREIRDAGGEALSCYGSVASRAVAQALIQTAIDNFGRVDILVNNAAVTGTSSTSISETTDTSYHDVMEVNVHGVWLVTQAAWPYMQARYVLFESSGMG